MNLTISLHVFTLLNYFTMLYESLDITRKTELPNVGYILKNSRAKMECFDSYFVSL